MTRVLWPFSPQKRDVMPAFMAILQTFSSDGCHVGGRSGNAVVEAAGEQEGIAKAKMRAATPL